MEKTIRVVVIDDNEVVTGSVKKYFCGNANINVVGVFNSGKAGFDYLVKHEVDKDIAIDIIRTLKQHLGNSSYVWNEYVKIMKEHNCDDTFIKILNKLIAVYGRGEAISECLFVLDEDNYLEL